MRDVLPGDRAQSGSRMASALFLFEKVLQTPVCVLTGAGNHQVLLNTSSHAIARVFSAVTIL